MILYYEKLHFLSCLKWRKSRICEFSGFALTFSVPIMHSLPKVDSQGESFEKDEKQTAA